MSAVSKLEGEMSEGVVSGGGTSYVPLELYCIRSPLSSAKF